MKNRFHWRDQDWFTWSDGRAFSKPEEKKFCFVIERQRVKGESHRQRFERVRAAIEKYEATKKKVIITEPGLIARARNWLAGRGSGVRMEVKP